MSRAIVLIAPILFVALAPIAATADAPAPPAPAIRFDEMTHDFGTLRSDQKQTIGWTFRNVGTAPLEIRGTAPSCGCTASVVDHEDVAPGGRGTITVTYDPAGQNGDVRKTLTVMTNDPAHPHTILTLKAKVIPVEEEPMPGGHPRFTGQSLLMGSCASCHAAPAKGKSGTALYAAVCAMCHGTKAEGGLAPALRAADYLASHDDKALGQAIAYGTANPKMPGFSDLMGGPLDASQVASLAALLRTWGPLPPKASASPPSTGR